jgi:hypothetical protein
MLRLAANAAAALAMGLFVGGCASAQRPSPPPGPGCVQPLKSIDIDDSVNIKFAADLEKLIQSKAEVGLEFADRLGVVFASVPSTEYACTMLTSAVLCAKDDKVIVDAFLKVHRERCVPTPTPACTLKGTGDLVNGDGSTVRYEVVNGTPGIVTYVLRSAPQITWWKSLSAFYDNNAEHRIETKDNAHEAVLEIRGTTPYTLALWKAGAFGMGRHVRTMYCDSGANEGKRIILTWVSD